MLEAAASEGSGIERRGPTGSRRAGGGQVAIAHDIMHANTVARISSRARKCNLVRGPDLRDVCSNVSWTTQLYKFSETHQAVAGRTAAAVLPPRWMSASWRKANKRADPQYSNGGSQDASPLLKGAVLLAIPVALVRC